MAVVYILFSKTLGRFYKGSWQELSARLGHYYEKKIFITSFTSKANDCELILTIGNLDYQLARSIEAHVKEMRNKTYM